MGVSDSICHFKILFQEVITGEEGGGYSENGSQWLAMVQEKHSDCFAFTSLVIFC